jgi:hypothetical protein
MSEWQPIETVPDDVEEILAWIPPGNGLLGYCVVAARDRGGDLTEGCEWYGIEDYTPYQPSHWMPLPNPPALPHE